MLQVLIVDDSLIIRKQIRKIIESLGHKVISEARNAQEAISMYSRFRVDLVTMDITMAGEDGITATKKIITNDANAKIIMITSHGQEDMVVDAIKAGATGYILKPITENKVSETINTILEHSK